MCWAMLALQRLPKQAVLECGDVKVRFVVMLGCAVSEHESGCAQK